MLSATSTRSNTANRMKYIVQEEEIGGLRTKGYGTVCTYYRQKSSLKECVFVNSALKMALKMQSHIVKNTLLWTDFSAILPTGLMQRKNQVHKIRDLQLCLQDFFFIQCNALKGSY